MRFRIHKVVNLQKNTKLKISWKKRDFTVFDSWTPAW